MPTIETSTEAALFARVAALVLSPVLPIAWPNVAFTKPAGGYLRVTHVPNTNRRLFLGSNDPHQRMGLLQVDVFKPLNMGASTATEIAGLVAAHFPCDLRLTSGGVTVRVTKAPDVSQAIADDTHWLVPVTVRYTCLK
ncbi:DUF4128 domain-containing protein [Mesorhizobium sp. B2-4-11]|uniref:DUF4128 domain-containing protein n=1 Tax=Mesorhizobium sp. B2-4-11 TaxID=2589938 RepID=UPI00112E5FDA|nr:DUF4128 domain-containing protein [Mesorhizobium sp. B2-4-11]TPL06684.1 hypothetical protein FJ944_22920 [Mesorhizobium sp. B2-4-11]